MTGPRIALIVDHPQRDLAGIVLTAWALCQRGAACYLVPHNGQDREIWALAPDFVLLNFARRGCEELAAGMVAAGIAFGVLDTEGAVWDTPGAYSDILWSDAALRGAVDPMCTWGPRMAEHLASTGLFTARQLHVTGCPRFDFYHPAWQSVLTPAAGETRPRILINTNFYTVNSRFASASANLAQLRDVLGWTSARAGGLIDRERLAIDATLANARALATDFPHATVVLRPHPFEESRTYAMHLAGLPNVTINTDGPVQQQICRAAVVIQRSCTTAIEAAFAGIPTLSPQWIAAPIDVPMAEAVSLPCATYEEMKTVVGAILESAYSAPSRVTAAIAGVTSDWFHAVDGRAHLRVADAVMSAVERRGAGPDRRVCSRYLYGLNGSQGPGIRQIGRWARHRFALGPDWSFRHMRTAPSAYWDSTNKAYGCEEVVPLLGALQRAGGGTREALPSVALARDLGECAHGFRGRTVKLDPVAQPGAAAGPSDGRTPRAIA
jgi:surface carbohydrate biosynthesis protein